MNLWRIGQTSLRKNPVHQAVMGTWWMQLIVRLICRKIIPSLQGVKVCVKTLGRQLWSQKNKYCFLVLNYKPGFLPFNYVYDATQTEWATRLLTVHFLICIHSNERRIGLAGQRLPRTPKVPSAPSPCSSDSCLKWRSCVFWPVLSARKRSKCLT